MPTYLVTGGAGFIGSNIVDELLGRGDTVKVLDDFSTGREENVRHFADDVELIRGDIRDADVVDKAVSGCNYVIHQAALASVPRSINDPTSSNQVNVQGTLNLLEAAVKHSAERFVYASSSSVYGDSEVLPKVETMPTAPKSPYAVTKLCGELYCRVFGEIHGLTTVSLRYFNVFGPRQDPNSQYSAVIPLFVKHLLQGTRATIYGDGEQTRDFTFINNVVSANLLGCEANISGAKVYNVACGDRFSLNKLYGDLSGLVGVSIEPEFAPTRVGDVKHSMADIDRISEETGYRPGVGFEEGLRRTVDWYREAGVEALG
jgi:nucleoside-diphosphate-sugar epimerase